MVIELKPIRKVLICPKRGQFFTLVPVPALPSFVRSTSKTYTLEQVNSSGHVGYTRKIRQEYWLLWRGKMRKITRMSWFRGEEGVTRDTTGSVSAVSPVTLEVED